jgi:hypothetical protein
MRPNGGLTGPCVRASQATRSRNDRSAAARRSRISPWAASAADRRADAAARHEEARETPRAGVQPGASTASRAQGCAMTSVEAVGWGSRGASLSVAPSGAADSGGDNRSKAVRHHPRPHRRGSEHAPRRRALPRTPCIAVCVWPRMAHECVQRTVGAIGGRYIISHGTSTSVRPTPRLGGRARPRYYILTHYCIQYTLKGTDSMVNRYIAQCSCSGSPACRQCSRTSWRSIPTTQPSSACAEHARATRLHKVSAAAGAQRAPVPHMHPCTHAARECFPRPRPARVHPGSSSAADQRTRAASEA